MSPPVPCHLPALVIYGLLLYNQKLKNIASHIFILCSTKDFTLRKVAYSVEGLFGMNLFRVTNLIGASVADTLFVCASAMLPLVI
jgi:hypothetical protein